jgi:deazaflavin-dependent oxidoreductase (nitroreductase family)
MPLWFGHINKRIFNKLELRKGKRPVLAHVGRSSGKTYRTPLDAHPVADGYMFILVYGSGSDWVQNILAAGSAILEIDGKRIDLEAPRIVGPEVAIDALPEGTRRPPKFMNVTEFLQMDLSR